VIDMAEAYGSINGDAEVPAASTPGFGAILLIFSLIAAGCVGRILK